MNVKQNTIANGAIAFLTVLTVTLAQCALFAGAAVTFDEDRWTTMSMNNPVQGHSLSFSAVSAHWLEN